MIARDVIREQRYYAYRTRSTPNNEFAHPSHSSSLPDNPGLHFHHHHHHHYLPPHLALFAEDPPIWSAFGGVSIEILIFDQFGVLTSWFAPRQH